MSEALQISLPKVSYLTSASPHQSQIPLLNAWQVVVIGLSPLFWKVVSNRYRRRPIFVLSTFCSTVCNIGCAESQKYGVTMVCRMLEAFLISPPTGIGTAKVTKLFFKREQAQKMGIWTNVLNTDHRSLTKNILQFNCDTGTGLWTIFDGFRHQLQQLALNLLGTSPHTCTSQANYCPTILLLTEPRQTRVNSSFTISSAPKYATFVHTIIIESPSNRSVSPLAASILNLSAFTISTSQFRWPVQRAFIPAVSYSIVFTFARVLNAVEIPQLFV